MKVWLIKKLLAWLSTDEERNRILTEAVKQLYNTVGRDDILQVDNDQWVFRGKILSAAQRQLIVAEAQQFIESFLWKVLQADVKWKANEKMYIEARSEMQIAAGKFWLYTLDTIKTRLNSLKNDSALFNKS